MRNINKYYKIIILILSALLIVALINNRNNLQKIDKYERTLSNVLIECMNDLMFAMVHNILDLTYDMESYGETTGYSLREFQANITTFYKKTQQIIRIYGNLNNSMLSMNEDIYLLTVNDHIDEICAMEAEKGKNLGDDILLGEYSDKFAEIFIFAGMFVDTMIDNDIMYSSYNDKPDVKQWCDRDNIDLFYKALTEFLRKYSEYIQNNI